MHNAPILLIIVPLFAGAFAAAAKTLGATRACKAISMASSGACLAILATVYAQVCNAAPLSVTVGGWTDGIGITLTLDGLAWFGACIASGVTLASLAWTIGDTEHPPLFYAAVPLMLAGMMGVLMTRDLFNLFVCLEILAAGTTVLIACRDRPGAFLAALRYLLMSSAAMVLYLVGVFIVYQAKGSVSYAALADFAHASPNEPLVTLALSCLCCGLAVRVAFVPFHGWLAGAYSQAPHGVSAILAGALSKMSLIALWRILDSAGATDTGPILVWLGAISALGGVVWALAQTDAKRMLACHSISQVGFIIAAIGTMSDGSMSAALYHTLNHAQFKTLLFLVIGSAITVSGEREISKLGGLFKSAPLMAIALAVAACSIAGVPPFNGYVSKKLIFDSIGANTVVGILLWCAAAGTVASFIKLLRALLGSAPPGGAPGKNVGALSLAPVAVLAIACLATGLAPSFWISRIAHLARVAIADAPVYTWRGILDSAATIAAGLLVYAAVRSRAGQCVSGRIRALHTGTSGAILTVIAAFAFFAIAGLWVR